MKMPLVSAAALAAAATLALAPETARACGGCFVAATESTVVTAHRMAVSISPTETTLWDQIEYAGSPEDFVWVLPIQGTTLVELADNAFFEALEETTRVTLSPGFSPVRTWCPDPCGWASCPGWGPGRDAASASDAGAAPPVTVYGEAVVGPYETVTIGSEDPEALVTWLRDNGYDVPDAILPVVRHYTDLGLNFAVLRLSPNAGVSQMQPVRITTPGLMPVFPLRMIAAGASGTVGLELYVIAEGRWGAQNFAVGEISPDALYYDWNTSRYNYDQAFQEALSGLGSRAWIAEYAQPSGSWQGALRYYESYDESGMRHTAEADLAVATRSVTAPYLTKLRTDVSVEHLDQDLILEAASGGDISGSIIVYNERNRPPDVTCSSECTRPPPTCPDASSWPPGTTPAGDASGGDGLCAVDPGPHDALPLAFLSGLVACVVVRRRRRRQLSPRPQVDLREWRSRSLMR